MATKLTSAKRQSYTVSDKLRIVQLAEQNGNRAAEREVGLSESNVRLWRRSKEDLEKMPYGFQPNENLDSETGGLGRRRSLLVL